MYLSSLYIQNLRCFQAKQLDFGAHMTLIEGPNGSGKTTIIEALYYLCYLRSFRTNLTQELISFEHSSFFIKAGLKSNTQLVLQVGFSPDQRVIKLNDQAVSSFKQLIDYYRVVVLTADDLALIQGGPEIRRSFIDQYIYLQNPDWLQIIRHYKRILDQRNQLLKSSQLDLEHYHLWTKQLIAYAELIGATRKQALKELETALNQVLTASFGAQMQVELNYQTKLWQTGLQIKEQFMQRTLFGAHLEDYQISLSDKSSRKFASRGQQKLLAILLKIVQVKLLRGKFDGVILFLLDDFITELDESKTIILFDLLRDLAVQLVFTAPNMPIIQKNWLLANQATVIML